MLEEVLEPGDVVSTNMLGDAPSFRRGEWCPRLALPKRSTLPPCRTFDL